MSAEDFPQEQPGLAADEIERRLHLSSALMSLKNILKRTDDDATSPEYLAATSILHDRLAHFSTSALKTIHRHFRLIEAVIEEESQRIVHTNQAFDELAGLFQPLTPEEQDEFASNRRWLTPDEELELAEAEFGNEASQTDKANMADEVWQAFYGDSAEVIGIEEDQEHAELASRISRSILGEASDRFYALTVQDIFSFDTERAPASSFGLLIFTKLQEKLNDISYDQGRDLEELFSDAGLFDIIESIIRGFPESPNPKSPKQVYHYLNSYSPMTEASFRGALSQAVREFADILESTTSNW